MVEIIAFTLDDELTDACGDGNLQFQSVLQGNQTSGSLSVNDIEIGRGDTQKINGGLLSICDQFADVELLQDDVSSLSLEVAASHAQILDELVSVLALLAGGAVEELGESWAVDVVSGEVSGHFQILKGSCDFLLDLFFGCGHTLVLHVDEVNVGEDISCFDRAWKQRIVIRNQR